MRKFARRHMLGYTDFAYGFDCKPKPGSFIVSSWSVRGTYSNGKQRVMLAERRAV